MDKYDYGSPSPSPSPSPADIHARNLHRASLPERLLELRRRAIDEGHFRPHQQQQQQPLPRVINMDHRFPPVRMPDGTTRTYAILCTGPPCPEDATGAYSRRLHRANTAATPYDRPENHVCWTTRRRQQSPDDNGASRVVCVSKMISPGARLEDDGFYQPFLENVTEDASKFGDLVKVVIPRPSPGIGGRAAPVVTGVGKVFLEYMHSDNAAWCRRSMDRLWYGGNELAAELYPQSKFAAGDYE